MLSRMAHTVLMVLVLVAIYPSTCAGLQYLFTSSEYTLTETGTADTVEVKIQRTADTPGDTSETSAKTSVELETVCPTACPIMPGIDLAIEGSSSSGGDYTVSSKMITFDPNVLQKTIFITVHADGDEELREYFCLSVKDSSVRGSQWTTKIIIPWNDHCIKHESIPDGDSGDAGAAKGYNIEIPTTAVFGYIGPWDTPEEAITIKLDPQPSGDSGDGEDFMIFLTTIADTSNLLTGTVDYYGIYLDNTNADTLDGTTTGDSYIAKYTSGDGPDGGTLVGSSSEETTDIVTTDSTNILELSYDSGTITLDGDGSAGLPLTATDTSPLDIKHLFVSTALDKYALWEICGLDPWKLPRVDASASGYRSRFGPDRVIDDVVDPISCFVSEPDPDTNKHWLQVDLGREFKVEQIIIFPTIFGYDELANPEWLDNAQVYVGSCRPDDYDSNHVCDSDIGDHTGADPLQDLIIEVKCTGDNVYGRYVYIVADTDTNRITLCDVMVYGREVPIEDETKAYFTDEETEVEEDATSGDVTLSITRTGHGRTCTYVDYYTDTSNGDFTGVLPSATEEIKISRSSAQSDEVSIDIDITNDDTCESTETFNVYLTDIEGGLLGTRCWTTVEIEDDDSVTYSIISSSTSINEGSGPLSIQVDRTGEGLSQDGRATLTFTDISATSHDYDNSQQTLYYSSSYNSRMSPVTIHDDECFEGSETFQVNLDQLEPGKCSGIGAGLPLTMTVTDNDSQFEWDVSTDNVMTLSEGSGSTIINIIREGTMQRKIVEFDVDHGTTDSDDLYISPASSSVTLSAGDASEPVTITIPDDYDVEGDESFTLTLRDPNGENCPNGNRGDDYRLHIKIEDDDAEYYWENTAYEVDEGDRHVEVCLARTGDTTTTRTVQITTNAGAAALSGSDFTPLTEITFSGTQRMCEQIMITSDDDVEGDEMFSLTITEGQNIAIGTQNTATVTINDDDSIVGWEQPAYGFIEGSTTTATVYISKSGVSAVTVSVTSGPGSVLSSGLATPNSDFRPVSVSILIPAATNRYPLNLEIMDDENDEPSEIFVLTLTAASTGVILQATTTITITDDDPTPTEPPPGGLSSGAIAGIAVGAVVGAIAIVGVIGVGFYLFSQGAGAASAGAAGAAGGTGTAATFGAKQAGMQLVNLGYPQGNAFGVMNNGFGNQHGYESGFGFDNFGNNPAAFGYP